MVGRMEKAIFLVLILEIFFVATATTEETCKSEREIEEQCGPHTYKTVKPMLDYFRQIRNELEISEFKEKQLSELNSNLMDKYHEIVKLHEKVIKEASLIDQYKNQIQSKENELQLYKEKVDKLESDIELQKNTINGLTPNSKFFEHFDKCKEELVVESKNLEICEVQLKKLNSSLINKDENISGCNAKMQNVTENLKKIEVQFDESQTKLKNKEKDQQVCQGEVDKLNEALQNSIPSSCVPFGQYPGYREIKVLGSGIFSVLCDSQLAGPGWIVIQQRVGGNESFDRDWATYRKGFGSFDKDFFLGLENIYRLTNSQRYELYMHLVFLNGTSKYARYDDFKISDESQGYVLRSLCEFKGSVNVDAMRYSQNRKFTTLDRDNDVASSNCAVSFKSGWWYGECFNSNFNALYGIDFFWYRKFNPLKVAKMLIRPKKLI